MAALRRLAGTAQVGHTGTLDPPAAGVLPLCVGPATRLSEYLAGADKEYRAWIRFGVATDTLDATGRPLASAPADHLTAEQVASALGRFRGDIEQVPPLVSAVKVAGRKLYQAARAGIDVERPARKVRIDRLELLDWRPGAGAAGPAALVHVVCSKGTYVRSLAADLGESLGTVAHLEFLLRTRSGLFPLERAVTWEELQDAASRPGGWATVVRPPAEAVGHLPKIAVDVAAARSLRRDGLWRWGGRPDVPAGIARIVGPGGDLVGIAVVSAGGVVRLRKVLPEAAG